MPLTDVAPLSATIEIDAPPAEVWAKISDLRNMARWSPQTAKSFRRGGSGVGAKFLNVNRLGLLVWPTQSKVVRFTKPAPGETAEIAWRVKENFTVWSLKLTQNAAGGSTLTSTREAPDGISDVSVRMTKMAFGGVPKFSSQLEADMAVTLAKIKADVEN